jgi:hypothetical protein
MLYQLNPSTKALQSCISTRMNNRIFTKTFAIMNMQEFPSILTLESTNRGPHWLGVVAAGDVRSEVPRSYGGRWCTMAARSPSRASAPAWRAGMMRVARGVGGWHGTLALKDDDSSIAALRLRDNDGGPGQWQSAAGRNGDQGSGWWWQCSGSRWWPVA